MTDDNHLSLYREFFFFPLNIESVISITRFVCGVCPLTEASKSVRQELLTVVLAVIAPAKLLTALPSKAEECKLGRILIETTILPSMRKQSDAVRIRRDAAQAYKVDVDAISATVQLELAAKEKSRTAKRNVPKPQVKSGKKVAA